MLRKLSFGALHRPLCNHQHQLDGRVLKIRLFARQHFGVVAVLGENYPVITDH
jgi:hypothetical protein